MNSGVMMHWSWVYNWECKHGHVYNFVLDFSCKIPTLETQTDTKG